MVFIFPAIQKDMGQSEILDFLCKNPENWFLASEVSKATKINKPSIQKALKRLVKNDEILRKDLPFSTSGKTPFLYKLND